MKSLEGDLSGGLPQASRTQQGIDKEEFPVAYHQGVESGLEAKDAHKLSSQLETPRPEFGIINDNISFRKGYIDGLKGFIIKHKVDPTRLGIWTTLETLTEDDALRGYLRGLRRQSPNVAREYPTRKLGNKLYLNDYPEPEWLRRMRTQSMSTRGGYELGFAIGLVRDFDIALGTLELPTDDPAYDTFMAGLKAEPRALPLERKPYEDKEYLIYYNEEDPFTAQLRAYEMADNTMYLAGLRIWLHIQGVADVPTWDIRHLEALRAFKAGLSGEVLPEYSEQPIDPLLLIKPPCGKEHDVERILFTEEITNKSKLLDDRLNPFEEARMQGRKAYQLGLKARLARLEMEAKSQ